MTARQIVELFHLVFVRALFANLSDKSLLALKGGLNLRFYFQSIRFSEDLDLDVVTMSKAALENRVDRLLASPTVTSPLKARGIVIQDISKPKQTNTVQRWKLEVASASASIRDRTKIEFQVVSCKFRVRVAHVGVPALTSDRHRAIARRAAQAWIKPTDRPPPLARTTRHAAGRPPRTMRSSSDARGLRCLWS